MPEDINAYIFPGGKYRPIPVSALGDAVTNLSPGAGFRWIILRAVITLAADGNAANRYINFEIWNGAVLSGIIGQNNTAITLGQTKIVAFGEAIVALSDWNDRDVIGNILAFAGFRPIIISGADVLRITCTGGLAGDVYSGRVTVLEMKL